jgi:hypothetical protein
MAKLLGRYRRHLRAKAVECGDAAAAGLIEMQWQCLPWLFVWLLPMLVWWMVGVPGRTSVWVIAPCIGTSMAGIGFVG